MNVGLLSSAHLHAGAYAKALIKHSDVNLVSVWDEDEIRGRRFANAYEAAFYEDLSQFFSSGIDSVVICSENTKHKEHVLAAAMAKKAILCEKPLATSTKDAEEMIMACHQENVPLHVAHPVRFSPIITKTKKLLDEDTIGRVVAVNATNQGQMPGGWFVNKSLSGGGAATDRIVHIMDLLYWMLGTEMKSVYAELDTRFHAIEVEDCGLVLAELTNGTFVTIDPSWSRPTTFPKWGDVRMKLIGTKGNLEVDILAQHFTYYAGVSERTEQLNWSEDMNQRLIDDFIARIQYRQPPFISGEDGKKTVEVIQAVYRSAASNQTVQMKPHLA
ncbi:Gfo/Idh/MocA family protein [Shouchella shacheensis]|uniref:Gfo/Idh/MocA family protein n=1 Tax=Shouchella shacheensis TaxID=1649580 RepID=UPI00074057C4|nr:Gfo/Idh/MocA family oxidoreductase [Shouchella shacheensis]